MHYFNICITRRRSSSKLYRDYFLANVPFPIPRMPRRGGSENQIKCINCTLLSVQVVVTLNAAASSPFSLSHLLSKLIANYPEGLVGHTSVQGRCYSMLGLAIQKNPFSNRGGRHQPVPAEDEGVRARSLELSSTSPERQF